MQSAPNYDIYTLAVGPCKSVDTLLSELSNHVGTFVVEATVAGGRVSSVSHSVFELSGELHASALITIETDL